MCPSSFFHTSAGDSFPFASRRYTVPVAAVPVDRRRNDLQHHRTRPEQHGKREHEALRGRRNARLGARADELRELHRRRPRTLDTLTPERCRVWLAEASQCQPLTDLALGARLRCLVNVSFHGLPFVDTAFGSARARVVSIARTPTEAFETPWEANNFRDLQYRNECWAGFFDQDEVPLPSI
jgi:hypothetical protein